MEVIYNVIKNVLIALYQYFGGALLIAIFFMYFYMQYREQGIKKTCKLWIDKFKTDRHFRGIFYLTFYVMMIILRTILCRNMWMNPVSNVKGVWTLYDADGELNTEGIENIALFMPFMALYLWAFKEKIFRGKADGFIKTVWKSIYISFVFSLGIELSQLFLRLGTFQLSDLFFNTLGGLIGGIAFFMWYDIKDIRDRKNKKSNY